MIVHLLEAPKVAIFSLKQIPVTSQISKPLITLTANRPTLASNDLVLLAKRSFRSAKILDLIRVWFVGLLKRSYNS